MYAPRVFSEPDLKKIVEEYGYTLESASPITTGLIHKTFKIETAERESLILQAVNPIFAPEVQEDIDAVTTHIAKKGLLTPRLLRTRNSALFVEKFGSLWRLMTYIEGLSFNHLAGAENAFQAGTMLARFHSALSDLDRSFKAKRLGVHDTERHLGVLKDALSEHRAHRLYEQVAPIGEAIFELSEKLRFDAVKERVVHGDPKINNLIFDPNGLAKCWVDLDTVGPMEITLELGDALRSWSNPGGEDTQTPEFSAPLFEAAISGYAKESPRFLNKEEIALIVPSTLRIMVELSARFSADALNERYFGWNSAKFATRGDHNLLRGRTQLLLAQSFLDLRARLEDRVFATFS